MTHYLNQLDSSYTDQIRMVNCSVRQKKVSPKVVCHFLSNLLEFLREILRVHYLFMNIHIKAPSGI